MSKPRMTGQNRKQAIVQVALPLFARQGFDATTTKQLAQAAGVSEALLYKHFPSKESLYAEIKGFGSQGQDPEFTRILKLKPSTNTVVLLVYGLMVRFVLRKGGGSLDWETRVRLLLHSCLEDGSFMRFLFKNIFTESLKQIVESLKAAAAAGDLVESPVSMQNRFVFTHHLAIMIGCVHLPDKPGIGYGTTSRELLYQAMWYALRGLGLKDDVIARSLDLAELERKLREVLS
jgi:AcrR family transcriptional regulator